MRYIDHPREIGRRFNQAVKTPLGQGMSFGHFVIRDREAGNVVMGVVVRLKVTDEVRARLKDKNCLTPKAQSSALFVFQEGDLR